MKKPNDRLIHFVISVLCILALFQCSQSCKDNMKESRKDPKVQERLRQEDEDLNNRLLDQHFKEDARKKR